MPSFVIPSGDVIRESAWTDEARATASEARKVKKSTDEKAVAIAKDWHNGAESALYVFSINGGKIKSEGQYRRLKSEVSDSLRQVIGNPNYEPKDAEDLHTLMSHLRSLGQDLDFEGAKRGKTAGYYYGGGCGAPVSSYPY